MKKTLLVLASCTLLGTAASAQSSVTMFGVVDLNGRWLDNNGVTQYSMSQDGLAPSRLGFRGVEDMGGGLKAGFWLEAPLNPDDGNARVGLAFTRRSTVSLSDARGEVRLGRDETATYYNTGHFDPFGDTGLGAAGNLTVRPPAVPVGGAYDTLVRANNMVAYFTPPNLAGGLYGLLQVAAGEGTYGNKFYGGRLGYAAGPFDVNVGYGETLVADDTYADNFNLGGSWILGPVKVSGFYGRITVIDNKQDNWFVGASMPWGQWTLRASYGHVERSGTDPDNVEGQKADQLAIGAVYWLSKRTAFYGTYSNLNNKGGASFIVGSFSNVAGGGAAANGDSQGAEFGVMHSF
jgi:predicted porin